MYAVIEIGGKQYRVEPGMSLVHEVIPGLGPKDAVAFERVLLIRDGDGIEIGRPYLAQARVTGEVEEVGRGPKVVVQRFRPKKGYRRMLGYRQPLMQTRILAIERGQSP